MVLRNKQKIGVSEFVKQTFQNNGFFGFHKLLNIGNSKIDMTFACISLIDLKLGMMWQIEVIEGPKKLPSQSGLGGTKNFGRDKPVMYCVKYIPPSRLEQGTDFLIDGRRSTIGGIQLGGQKEQ